MLQSRMGDIKKQVMRKHRGMKLELNRHIISSCAMGTQVGCILSIDVLESFISKWGTGRYEGVSP